MNLRSYLMIKQAYQHSGINPNLLNRLASAKRLLTENAATNIERDAAGTRRSQLPENFQQMNNAIKNFNAKSTPGGTPRGDVLRSLFVNDVYCSFAT